jgi:hypothetical protein
VSFTRIATTIINGEVSTMSRLAARDVQQAPRQFTIGRERRVIVQLGEAWKRLRLRRSREARTALSMA